MAILGYNTRGGDQNCSSRSAGRMYVSKYNLATPGTLTELHCLASTASPGSSGTARLILYAADGAGGNPGTRLYYSGLLATQAAVGEFELAVTGISVPLVAGDYWLGWVDISFTASGSVYGESTGGAHYGYSTAAPDPPPNPFGTGDTSGPRKHSVWGVVGAAANPTGVAGKIRFGSGLVVANEGSGVIRVDSDVTVVTKTVDESVVSSTTIQNDDHLFFATVSGALYEVEAYIIYSSNLAGGGGPDLRATFGEDGNSTRGLMSALYWTNLDASTVVNFPTDTGSAAFLAGTQDFNRVILAKGFHRANGGTFRFVWAQNTSGVEPTIVKAGSQLRYRRIA